MITFERRIADSPTGEVILEKNGERFTDWCNVLINGSGPINKWKCRC